MLLKKSFFNKNQEKFVAKKMLKAKSTTRMIIQRLFQKFNYNNNVNNVNCRFIGTTDINCSANSDPAEPQEVRINVPWGHLAGKWWGPQNVRPILALHGWQDNAGSFDKLIPLLPQRIGYLALDLPGHGFSSRIPDGQYYEIMQGLMVLNFVRHRYKWSQLSLCSHSMGAQLSFLYASIFPESCDLLICIDALLKPYQGSVDRRIRLLERLGDEFMLVDERNRQNTEPPSYPYDEIVDRWVNSTKSSVTRESVAILLKRAIRASESDSNKYFFTRDNRLKYYDFGSSSIPDEICFGLAERIKAPHLFVKAANAPFYEGKENFDKVIKLLKKCNPRFDWFTVNGSHHCHLNEPTLISGELSEFIEKYRPIG